MPRRRSRNQRTSERSRHRAPRGRWAAIATASAAWRAGSRSASVADRVDIAARSWVVARKPRTRNDSRTSGSTTTDAANTLRCAGVSERRRSSFELSVRIRGHESVALQVCDDRGEVVHERLVVDVVFSLDRDDQVGERRTRLEQLPDAASNTVQPVVLLAVEIQDHRLLDCVPRQHMLGYTELGRRLDLWIL